MKEEIFSNKNVRTVLVVGDNPEGLLQQFNKSLIVEPYIFMTKDDAVIKKNNTIKLLNQIIAEPFKFNVDEDSLEVLIKKVIHLEQLSDDDYFKAISSSCEIDEFGNAWSKENPNGKWTTYRTGDIYALPLILNDGKRVFNSLNKDVNWSQTHLNNTNEYGIVWDLMHDKYKPRTELERLLYNNMRPYRKTICEFGSKESYIAYNCSFWTYAFLDENGWKDIDDANVKPNEWIENFYNEFLRNLKPFDKITIFEYF